MSQIVDQLRFDLKQILQICKDDETQRCGWNTTTIPLAEWNMTVGKLADTLKRGVVEATKVGFGDRAETVFLRFLDVTPEPIPALEEAIRFLERLSAGIETECLCFKLQTHSRQR